VNRWSVTVGTIALSALVARLGLRGSDAAPPATPAADKPAAGAPSKPFEARLLAIAKEYLAYGRVDDQARWAPYLCRMPLPPTVRHSASTDAATHGQKLYSVFARDRKAYLAAGSTQPVEQVIVKESWLPTEVAKDGGRLEPIRGKTVPIPKELDTWGMKEHRDRLMPYARKDGKLYKAEKPAGLYIMFKATPGTADTDGGWVYGTVTADGKTVTAAGRVESCMGCHVKAKGDRMFGLPADAGAQ
jgi:hypothetical protein